jgi:hypothetical protein
MIERMDEELSRGREIIDDDSRSARGSFCGGRCGAPQRPHGSSNPPSETMSFLPAISHHRRAREPYGTLGGPRKRQWEG